ncbi:MAG: transcription antitermination factor NusB [Chloroflexi bacterium CFX4]|nr:transcription antitermination factor NusB [Chloroflexi bacterium CFX4]MDL1924191.1 transcription antitermination factor NusB [Chloroflexi bacterium CFX3]
MSALNRRAARTLALQALYEMDCTDHPLEDVMRERLESLEGSSALDGEMRRFAHDLVNGVRDHRAHLDSVIRQFAPEFPLDQMALIDRNLLRLALYEFAVSGRTPIKVAINEAIDLAKTFGAENTARFVNGVLGALALHEAELRATLGNKAASA